MPKKTNEVYDVLDTYVTDNNGRQLHGIVILEEIDGQGLHEAQFYYDSTKQELLVFGHNVEEIRDVPLCLEELHQRLYDHRREMRRRDVVWPCQEVLAYTIGHYLRRSLS